ncbi:MAG: hypothetical protein R3B72_38175 [Polyangiaceae bacterium]
MSFASEEHGFALELPAGWELVREPSSALGGAPLVAAVRRRGAEVIELTATFAAGATNDARLDGYIEQLEKGLAEGTTVKLSGRAKIQLGERPFFTQRLRLAGGKTDQHLLFATSSKKGALLFAFSAPTGEALNEMARLFKNVTFSGAP